MKLVIALATGAAAFNFGKKSTSAPVRTGGGGLAEMQDLANSNPDLLGRTIGFWDPFNLITEGDFWGIGNEATIGYLRHAEIKHGRVAMAAFLGFIVQSLPIVSGDHLFQPYKGYVAGVSPQEQWDNVPAIGKLQIVVAIGMLESYGEGAGNPEGYVHYTRGGLPGDFPEIAGRAGFGQVGLNLFDPFNWFDTFYPGKDKARGRQVEINNGRLAMLGIFSLLSESAAPGAVPPLTLVNYIVDASGITGLNFPSLDLPVIGTVGGQAFLNSFPQYTPVRKSKLHGAMVPCRNFCPDSLVFHTGTRRRRTSASSRRSRSSRRPAMRSWALSATRFLRRRTARGGALVVDPISLSMASWRRGWYLPSGTPSLRPSCTDESRKTRRRALRGRNSDNSGAVAPPH